MSFIRSQSGNIAVLFAMGFAVSAMVAAVAVDGAALYHERRMIQNAVDLAAIAAAPDPVNAETIAADMLTEAGIAGGTLTVTVGHYAADPTLAPADRFVPDAPAANAVRVLFERPGTLHFARGWAEAPLIGAVATATVTPEVAFSVGSRLASLSGGIANAVLNQLLGSSVSLTLADYNGLAGVEVDLLAFLDALAVELDLDAGTYSDLLAASAGQGELARALAASLDGADRLAALAVANAVAGNGAVPLGRLFELGGLGELPIGSSGDGLFAGIGALDILAAAAALSNGDRQVDLALAMGVPGLVDLDVSLAIGEPPQGGAWYAVGEAGSVARTAQIRLRLVATVLGSGVLAGAPIRLPLYLDMAPAEARVAGASCPSAEAPEGTASILARPGLLRLMVGEVADPAFGDFGSPPAVGRAVLVNVDLLGLTVLRVLGSALVEVTETEPMELGFSSSDIVAGTVRTARTGTLASSLTGSLLDNLDLEVPVLGLGLSTAGVGTLLRAILMPLTPSLDLTLARLLESVGLSLGEADVRVYGVRCTHAVLVG